MAIRMTRGGARAPLWTVVGLAAAAGAVAHPGRAAAAGCGVGALEGLGVPGVTVVSATAVAAAAPNPAYCDVVGTLNTSGDGAPPGSAGFELRLPANWNGKFLFLGVGGLAGSTYAGLSANPADTTTALARGYATAITDTGHLGGGTNASWALVAPGAPDDAKLADYFFRATHQVTVAGKLLVQGFYDGQAIAASYFDGCSNGGRQALVEASDFPGDYDGIIAGDPFFDIRSILGAVHVAKQQLSALSYIPASALPAIDAAIRASCDAADGTADGLIQNPAKCSFDPATLVCQAGQAGPCLTPEQAATLDAYFSATRTARGGLVYPGFSVSDLPTTSTGPLSGGGADLWTTGFVAPDFAAAEPWGNAGYTPSPIGWQFADHIIQDIVTRDPTYNLRDYGVSAGGIVDPAALQLFDGRIRPGDARDPKTYRTFIDQGRKLLIYHGFSDPALTPFRTINLYQAIARQMPGKGLAARLDALRRSVRLFMVPGMQHCVGGPGPNVFDTLTALDQWVTAGVEPNNIVASHYANNDPTKPVDRTMPLCAYPQQAQRAGEGDPNDAATWACTANQDLLEVGPNGVQAGLRTN